MLEKRRYPRYDKKVNVRYSTVGLAAVESSSVTSNISKSGVRLQISRLIKKGDALKVELYPIDRSDPPIKALGKIVWTRESGEFEIDAGLHFTKIKPSDAERLITLH